MAKMTKKEFMDKVEKILENMSKNKSFDEESLSYIYDVDEDVDKLILEKSPIDFFEEDRIQKIKDNLTEYLDASTIENLAYEITKYSKKVAINMQNCEAWVMDNNSYDQREEVKYFAMPDLDDYQGLELEEIEISLCNGHPIEDENDKFYLEDALKDTFKELKIDRENKEQEIEYDFDR